MLGEDLDQHHIAFKNPMLDQYEDKLNKALVNNYCTSVSNLLLLTAKLLEQWQNFPNPNLTIPILICLPAFPHITHSHLQTTLILVHLSATPASSTSLETTGKWSLLKNYRGRHSQRNHSKTFPWNLTSGDERKPDFHRIPRCLLAQSSTALWHF